MAILFVVIAAVKLGTVLLINGPRIPSGIGTPMIFSPCRRLGHHKSGNDVGQDTGEAGKNQTHKNDPDHHRIHAKIFSDSSSDAEEYFIVFGSV